MRNLRSMSLSIATVALLIIGFGGCSSGSNDTGDGSSTIGGKAVDGYLNEAIVCLDLDLNGNCSVANEPIANTDALGAYTLTVTADQQAHVNFDIAPIIVYGGIDNDTGKRFEGFLQAPNDGSAINITPLTTLVQKSVEIDTAAGTLTAEQIKVKIEEAKAKVKTILGISAGTALDADPVAQKIAGNDELISASLSLQKSIQTLAKAAASDSASTGKTEAELVEDMFEAFANGLADIDESVTANQSLDALLDATSASTANTDLIPPKALAVVDTAKLIGAKVREAFDGMAAGGIDDADAMKNIAMLIEQDLTNFETEFANYDVSSGAFTTAVDLNISDDGVFSTNYDFRTDGFTFEFNEVLDLNLTTTEITALINALPLTFQPWDLYESSDQYSKLTAFADVYAKVRAIKDAWLDEEQLLEAQNSTEVAAITIPSSFYSLYVDVENGVPYYAYTQVFFQSDFTISFDKYGYNGISWAIDSSDSTGYLLTSTGWVADSIALPFTVNADNSLTLTTDNTKASITSLKDIGNSSIFIPSVNLEVTMPPGSTEQYVRLENTADTYYLDENVTDYSTGGTFPDLESYITTACQGNYGIVGNETALLTFQSCEVGQTSGNIVKAIAGIAYDANNTVGTWAIETINEKSILVVTPDNPYEFSYGDDLSYPIFAVINNVVVRGNKDPLGNVSLFPVYNQTAIEAIKAALEAL